MKSFVGIVTYKRAVFYRKCVINIYRVKKNNLIRLGAISFNTGSTKGDESEIYTFLVDHKYLPIKQFENANGYYRSQDAKENGFQITTINS